jgi:predicted transcriptional regulator
MVLVMTGGTMATSLFFSTDGRHLVAVGHVIRRNALSTAMEVLSALREGALSSSRLAQRCNINYGRLAETLGPLLASGWVERREAGGGQEGYVVTEKGLQTFARYEAIWNEFQSGLKLTPGQERF